MSYVVRLNQTYLKVSNFLKFGIFKTVTDNGQQQNGTAELVFKISVTYSAWVGEMKFTLKFNC